MLIVGNDGLTVSLDGENMATYCTQLAQKHDVSKKKTGKFKTTAGSTIDVPVAAAGQTVDGNKLYESIYEAIDGKNQQRSRLYIVMRRSKRQVNLSHMVATTVRLI